MTQRHPSSYRGERDALNAYLDAAGSHPRLSPRQERAALEELAELSQARRDASSDARAAELDATYKRLRNRFLCANLRLVVSIANRYTNHWMPLVDRVQEGNLGLLKAVERFDPRHGTRFSTYAAWWVRHFITRAIVNRGRKIRIPAHLHRMFMKARAVRPRLRGELGREPTVAELAEALDIAPDKLQDAVQAMELRAVSLDAPVAGEDTRNIADTLVAPEIHDVDQQVDDERRWDVVARELQKLDDRTQDIIVHRFGLDGAEPSTLRRIGERHGVSRERIRQLQNRALRALREAANEDHRHAA